MPDFFQLAVAEQLKNLGSDVRLVVVHPNYITQHLLLDQFLDLTNVVYVRFSGEKLAQADLQRQLGEALQEQASSTALDALDILVLDECDRANASAFNTFLQQVMTEVEPGQGRVIVISRVCPRFLSGKSDLRAYTRFVPNDDSLMLWDYSQRDTETDLLEVRSFGSGHVLLNGQAVRRWDGLLPRSLFFYLIDRGMTTRNDIFATFWPNLSVREATNVFHVTKRKISEVLGTDLTVYWSGFYRISPDIQLSYDAIEFSEMVQNSQVGSDEQAIELLRRAISLYRGDFLTSLNSEWVMKRRDELLQTYVGALSSLAQMMEGRGKDHHAIGLYGRAANIRMQREDLAGRMMHLYHRLGMNQDALAIFDRLERTLKDDLAVSPTDDLAQLAAAIRAEQDGNR